ncbi:hypothetical protein BJX99DRAFT_257469 [Aspergillus californicus]
MVLHEQAFFPFQTSRYGCVGKQFALMEMRNVIARIVLEFDISFAPDETGETFDPGAKDTFRYTVGPLNLIFQERETKQN